MKKSRANAKKISGIVVSGDSRGASLGFPTANIRSNGIIPVEYGIYACWATVLGKRYVAAVSVGVNEMFGATAPTIEAHLLDFSGDIVGENIEIEFVKRLREMKRFDSVEGLVEQIEKDVEEAREILM